MLGGDLPTFGRQVVTEEITVEVLAKLLEQAIEVGFGLGARLLAQDVAQMFGRVETECLQVIRVDHTAIKQVAGEYKAAKQCVENFGSELL